MRYAYAYKTGDGARHEAAIEAPSRDVVCSTLRAQGIRPIKVVAADGSKANGEVRGVRKRAVAATVAAVAIVAGVVAYWVGREGNGGRGATRPTDAIQELLLDQTRRQIIGDAAVIEKGIRTGWSDVFDSEGDRFLASFAIPGVKASVRNTSVEELLKAINERNDGTRRSSRPNTIETQQILAMVAGVKEEARRYLAAGGSVVEYGKRLTERQDAEIALYERIENEVLKAKDSMNETAFSEFLDQRNDELRNLGIRPVVLPD